ncbi:MAG: LysM peptidoglycan-binding domain-containing protein [Firmicutes bacterium]|jgi:N-acetylmuramoyl-L-alanine amidase|nr:LysM peptidoglycan-binding domain-containing protein [Bacillota bacterium]
MLNTVKQKLGQSAITVVCTCLLVLSVTTIALAAAHTVVPGDTLWNIGQRYGVSVQEIQAANNIWTSLIYPGDILYIPDGAPAALSSNVASRGTARPSSRDVQLLAQMIRAEAEGEPYEGKVAVGAVILNRLETPNFPKTLAGVLYETDAFEPMLNGSFYQPPDEESIRAAYDAMAGKDPTGGALYFYNPATAQSPWIFTRQIITQIGNHVFAK